MKSGIINKKIQVTRYKNKISKYKQNDSLTEMRVDAIQILCQTLSEHLIALNQPLQLFELKENDLEKTIQDYETTLINCALIKTGGNQRKAAKLLKLKNSTLNAKIKRYGIPTCGLIGVMDS